MLKAYVGVASQQGLSISQPERDDTLSLVRRCARRGRRRFAFWAIFNDAEAQSIQALFLDGHRRAALIALNDDRKLVRVLAATECWNAQKVAENGRESVANLA
jgi:hypothetical protein